MKALQSKSIATRTFTLVIGVLFLSFSLFSQSGPNSDSEFTEPELKIEKWMTDITAFESTYEEANLQVEAWMTDINKFEAINEEPLLAVENWMTDMNAFDAINEEPLLAVDSWMINTEEFKNFMQINPELLFAEANEKAVKIESWMTNIGDFNNYSQDDMIVVADEPIEIEGWMVNIEEFFCIPMTQIPTLKSIDLEKHAPVLIALQTSPK